MLAQKHSMTQKYSMTWKIRKIHKLLSQTSDQYLQSLGLSVGERAVIEFLSKQGEITVPELARLFYVSRQNIQVRMNGLAKKNVVKQKINPAHKSSVLWVLTKDGKEIFTKISSVEKELMGNIEEGLFTGISEEEVLKVNKVLTKFTKNLMRNLGDNI